MDPIKLTRRLIDIESISGNEGAVGAELYEELFRLGYTPHKMPVARERFNVVATLDDHPPQVVFSTHMDTVPPFIPSSEDDGNIYGRGSCDAKGIIAAQIAACQRLRKEGGRAPNVLADHARAQLFYRLVGPSEPLRRQIEEQVEGLAQAEFALETPFMKLRTVTGIDSMVAKFTTDIPWLSNWGAPVLIGPGSIHVAHTEQECISQKQLHKAVDLYCSIVRQLLST